VKKSSLVSARKLQHENFSDTENSTPTQVRKKGKKEKKKQLPITRRRININPIFITSRTAS
jgi:hypothetical protein